ncbi:hypothetical protein BH09MYX1_BH09MYX1_03260 [soil metagenome]
MRSWLFLSCVVTLTVATRAEAEPVRAHAGLGGAAAAGAPQSSEFGPGAAGLASVEIPVGRHLGFEGEVGALFLAPGNPTPGFAPKDVGVVFSGMGGARVRFLGRTPAGPWIAGHAGAAITGNRARFAFDAELGWDFRAGGGRFDVGPFASYLHVVEPDGGLAPQDAHVFIVGIAIGLGAPTLAPDDTDHDGIFDVDDACVTEPGIPTDDPKTNGCPRRDADRDTILDVEDACPEVPGLRTNDPKTNGCPRRDRDHDDVLDDEDACPDVAGARTSDPKTNGCPPDRDHDQIVDAEDACPDLAGVKSPDPKANGCPPPSDGARVVGDRIVIDDIIHFDTDSARVRHISWPVVKKLADFLRSNPDIVEIYVEGHADQTGPSAWNQTLSQDRADSVKRLLVMYSVDEKRVTTRGFGSSHLRTVATTTDGLRENRRVEIIITRTTTAPGGTP